MKKKKTVFNLRFVDDERLEELVWIYCLKKEIDSINVSMKKIKKITKDLQALSK